MSRILYFSYIKVQFINAIAAIDSGYGDRVGTLPSGLDSVLERNFLIVAGVLSFA